MLEIVIFFVCPADIFPIPTFLFWLLGLSCVCLCPASAHSPLFPVSQPPGSSLGPAVGSARHLPAPPPPEFHQLPQVGPFAQCGNCFLCHFKTTPSHYAFINGIFILKLEDHWSLYIKYIFNIYYINIYLLLSPGDMRLCTFMWNNKSKSLSCAWKSSDNKDIFQDLEVHLSKWYQWCKGHWETLAVWIPSSEISLLPLHVPESPDLHPDGSSLHSRNISAPLPSGKWGTPLTLNFHPLAKMSPSPFHSTLYSEMAGMLAHDYLSCFSLICPSPPTSTHCWPLGGKSHPNTTLLLPSPPLPLLLQLPGSHLA